MRFAVLGTGQVGSALTLRLLQLGHEVSVGSRNPDGDKAKALEAAGATIASYAEASRAGDWIVNALPGESVLDILSQCDLDGKVLIDISNYNSAVDQPIMEPIGQLIQQRFPKVFVVKALNSVSAHLMVDPQSLGKPHSVFVSSDHAEAKGKVIDLLGSFGWQSIIDLGDLGAARAMEQLIPLWMRLEEYYRGPNFNLAVVSPETPR